MLLRLSLIIIGICSGFTAGAQLRLQSAYSAKPDTIKSLQISVKRPVQLERPAPFIYNYYNQLGAACKVELKLERATKVPLRIRLGSLQQTDYLEQKPNARKPD